MSDVFDSIDEDSAAEAATRARLLEPAELATVEALAREMFRAMQQLRGEEGSRLPVVAPRGDGSL